MTCIVGIAHDNKVYIGGERSAADEVSILPLVNPKVGRNADIIYGYCGTIGIGQLIDIIHLPPIGDKNPYLYIRTQVVKELKKAIDSYSREGNEYDTTWLIGCQGHLYEVSQEDWSVIEIKETAVGSGGSYALGSLHSTLDLIDLPLYRIDTALQAAIHYSPTCLGPIDMVEL